MALPLIAPVVAVAHSSGGFIAAKVTANGLVFISGTLTSTASASLVAGTAAVQTTFAAWTAATVAGVAGTATAVASVWPW